LARNLLGKSIPTTHRLDRTERYRHINPRTVETTLTQPSRWSLPTTIAFRFFFVYFVFYIAPFPLYWIPFTNVILEPFIKLSFGATELLGKTLFGAGYILPPTSTGSGDTMHNYVQLVFGLMIATGGAMVWSIVDGKRSNYDRLLYWFVILLRYYLAVTMLSYGFAKVFRTQFPPLTLGQLGKSYGESSPMNLLWTFMGYSGPYTVFTGLGEVVGGLLLLFKRTRLLGALVVAIVMTHVVMLNLSYDVPVKLYSAHLLLMAIIIMSPDSKRLLNFFLLNKAVLPEPAKPLYNTQKRKWIYFAGKSLILMYLVGQTLIGNLDQKRQLAEYFARAEGISPIDGQYEVETFVLNNDTLPPIEKDTRRWKSMMINGKEIRVESMDGAAIKWHFLGNVGYRRMVIHSPDLSTYGNFTFHSDSTRISIEGTLINDTLKIIAHKKSNGGYLLVNRGFHWVNEYPFNQ
jgi:uncharacterized membrane protein YphA (DoxX/SURF4 family)